MGVRAAQTGLRVAGAIALVWVLYLLRANVWLRLYPAALVTVALVVFAVSLWGMPLVERIARARGEALDARGVAYCRAVTRAWVIFLSLHLAVTVATAFAPPAVWAFYTGALAYVLLGAMFGGEWLVRRRVRHG